MTVTPETPSLDPLEDLFEDGRQLQTQSRALRTRTTFAWGPRPESEIARLTERLPIPQTRMGAQNSQSAHVRICRIELGSYVRSLQ
jgi:hypothetical protein